jgi:hypothetical protein
MDEKTARKYRDLDGLPSDLMKPCTWRTRKAPFEPCNPRGRTSGSKRARSYLLFLGRFDVCGAIGANIRSHPPSWKTRPSVQIDQTTKNGSCPRNQRFWVYLLLVAILASGCRGENDDGRSAGKPNLPTQEELPKVITVSYSSERNLVLKTNCNEYQSLGALEGYLISDFDKFSSRGILLIFCEKEGPKDDMIMDYFIKYARRHNIDLFVQLPLNKLPRNLNKPRLIYKRESAISQTNAKTGSNLN